MSRILLPPGYAKRQRGFIINPYAYATAGGGTSGNALLHFNAASGSTDFTDTEGYTWERISGRSTAIYTGSSPSPKFGSGSLDCSTSTAYQGGIRPTTAFFQPAGADFTIDFWVYLTGYYGSTGSNNPYLFGLGNSLGAYDIFRIYYYDANKIALQMSTNGSSFIGGQGAGSAYTIAGEAAVITLNGWYHIALVRSGSNLRLFVGGALVGSTYNISSTVLPTALKPGLGSFNGDNTSAAAHEYGCKAFFDELRMLKGTAVWTGTSFTVPSGAYSTPSG